MQTTDVDRLIPDRLYQHKQAAKFLGISPANYYRHVYPNIEVVQVSPGSSRAPGAEILRIIAERTRQPVAA